MSALADIGAERARQIAVEGWTEAHDDAHTDGSLACAAAAYALNTSPDLTRLQSKDVQAIWPWSLQWWKPKDPRHDLVRAGALIVAEIERLDRVTALEAKS